MDDKGHLSGHLMLITPQRVFYAGLLGRPRERCPGAFHVYVAIKGGLWLTAGNGFEQQGELVVVPPNVVPSKPWLQERLISCARTSPSSTTTATS